MLNLLFIFKSKTTIENVSSLLVKLKWLLGELNSYETHLEKARFDSKIQLKREHDELLRAATTGRAIQTNGPDVDPWEDELISKVSRDIEHYRQIFYFFGQI